MKEKKIARIAAIAGMLAFLFCLAAGVWILANTQFDPSEPLAVSIGLYFVGKALFAGPMLIITAMRQSKEG
jgi:hypothetical protein